MWLLDKDERRLLAGYYRLIGSPERQKAYRLADLTILLRVGGGSHVPEYGNPEPGGENSADLESVKREAAQYIELGARVEKANRVLAARGLITVAPDQPEMRVVVLGLTVPGYDLGRRYSRFLQWTHLWFQEYRNHWIWLIIAALGGGVFAKVIDCVVSLLTKPWRTVAGQCAVRRAPI